MKRALIFAVMLVAFGVQYCFALTAATSTSQKTEFGSGVIFTQAGDSEKIDSIDTNDYFLWLSDYNTYANPVFRIHLNRGAAKRVRIQVSTGQSVAELCSTHYFDTATVMTCTTKFIDTVLPIASRINRLVKLRFIGMSGNPSACYIKWTLQVKKKDF